MTDIATFIFQGWEVLEKEGKILFHYTLKKREKEFHFTDTLILPGSFDTSIIPTTLSNALLQNMLLMLGISYWKLYCPKDIQIASFTLTRDQATFWNTVYTKGLGEFFYENKIDFRDLVQFPYDENKTSEPLIHFPRENRSLLPLGGGKDSVVAGELLKKLNKDFSIVTFYTGLNNNVAQEAVAKQMGKEVLQVKRMLDPQLFALNKEKDTYNGHIPAVAIHSFVSVFLAALQDFRYVILANEESASYGSVEYLSEIVNHQWSKSVEFEQLFRDYLATYVTQDIEYFSILRPFSEIKIAKLFSVYPEYFPLFVSCNRGYIMAKKGKTSWCGECPKCAFVFLLLSAFISKDKLLAIFGKNLFDDKNLIPLYKELLGITNFKPFECVGTPEETRLALHLAWEKGEWSDTALMKVFVKDVLPHMQNHEEQKAQLFTTKAHMIPEEFSEVLEI